MMKRSEAWEMAKQINEATVTRAPFTREMFAKLGKLDKADSDLVVHMTGIAYRARNRALSRDAQGREMWNGTTIESGRSYDQGPLAPKWYVAKWNTHGDSVVTRYYCDSHDAAYATYQTVAPEENHADYSPTGKWFRGTRTIRHLRGHVYVVTSHCSQDV